MLYQIIVSAVILIVGVVLRGIVSASLRRKVKTQGLNPQSALLGRKIATGFILAVAALAAGVVWGVGPRAMLASLAGIVTLVIVGFFAVWCILSNIVAGFILLVSRPFGIGDEIVVLPENIQGTVTNITSVFLVLEDNEGAKVTIPNNYIFQRIVKKVQKRPEE